MEMTIKEFNELYGECDEDEKYGIKRWLIHEDAMKMVPKLMTLMDENTDRIIIKTRALGLDYDLIAIHADADAEDGLDVDNVINVKLKFYKDIFAKLKSTKKTDEQ